MDRIEDKGDEVDSSEDTDVKGAQQSPRVSEDGPSAEERRRDAYRLS